MNEPFVMIPVSLRERLHELSPSEFMVWAYYRLRAGKDGIAFASAETLCQDLGLCRDTVCAARSSLVRKGWLLFKAQAFGGVQKFQVVIPVVGKIQTTDKSRRLIKADTSRRQNTDTPRRKNADTEVDTGVDTGEVDKTCAPKTGALEFPLPEWIPRDAWDAYVESRKKRPTPKAVALLVKKLDGLRQQGQNVREVLEQTVMNGWTGVFPVKGGTGNGHSQGKQPFDLAANYKAIFGTSKPN